MHDIKMGNKKQIEIGNSKQVRELAKYYKQETMFRIKDYYHFN